MKWLITKRSKKEEWRRQMKSWSPPRLASYHHKIISIKVKMFGLCFVCRIILTVTDLKSELKVLSVINWARRIFRYLRIERFVKNVKEFWSVSGYLISTFPQIPENRSPWLFFIQICTNANWYYHNFPFSKKRHDMPTLFSPIFVWERTCDKK